MVSTAAIITTARNKYIYVVCVCVCVCEGGREREKDTVRACCENNGGVRDRTIFIYVKVWRVLI